MSEEWTTHKPLLDRETLEKYVKGAPLRYTLAASCAMQAYPLVSSAPFRWAYEQGWAALAERVDQVINDPKYSRDIEWVRMNLRPALQPTEGRGAVEEPTVAQIDAAAQALMIRAYGDPAAWDRAASSRDNYRDDARSALLAARAVHDG